MFAMTGRTAQACLLLAWLLRSTNGRISDVHVTCRVSEDCVLPCIFEPSGGEKIHWYLMDVLIYSHPGNGSDRLTERFEDGTSVSTEQLALGNASLILHQCGPRNRGRYRCRVINGEQEKNSFIMVKVQAPIRSVNVKMTRLSGYEEVKCSTSDVYPAPQVSWSTDPSTSSEKIRYTSRNVPDKQGRYSMESKVKTLDHDLTYICTLNSSATQQTWRAFLKVSVLNNVTLTSSWYTSYTWADMKTAEHQNLTIPCKAPWDLQDFILTWTFTREERTVHVCTYDSRTDLLTDHWKSTTILELQRLRTGDASLRLVNLRSLEHTGVYVCNISAFQKAHVGRTGVNVTSVDSENKRNLKNSATQWWIPAVALVLLAVLAAFIMGMVKLRGGNKSKHSGNSRDTKVTVPENEDPSEGIRLTANQSVEHT